MSAPGEHMIYDRCCCSLSHIQYVSMQEREKEGDEGREKYSEAIYVPPGHNIEIWQWRARTESHSFTYLNNSNKN